MLKVEATVKGAERVARTISAEKQKARRSFEAAVRVEAFRQLKQLREDVRAGRPGGHPYAAFLLSAIASRTKSGRPKKRQVPLYRVARLIRYDIKGAGTENPQISFGFVRANNPKLTSSYKQLLLKHQEGIDVLYAGSRTELGVHLARVGAKLKKKGDPDAKYFFLRKETGRKIDLPQRDIIRTFWAAHKMDAMKNIRQNYRLKMKGVRI
ncbi:hypothetical protein [Desulfatitalea tepidiphila]|uniref:hypothetical protein n=1 Tax=Desulfatitalea tepidiphila TaxID=1185843 RepID=UPI00128F596B|nr:hypothetical protein [Desulfatitalea tepidiphila]